MIRKILFTIVAAALTAVAVADTKISELPDGAALGGTEAIPAVQTGATVKTTPAALATYVNGTLISTGTFTATFQNGFTTDLTQNFSWYKFGDIVLLQTTSTITGTSDSTGFAGTSADLPAAIRPVASQTISVTYAGTNNGVGIPACLQVTSAGIMSYGLYTGGVCSTNSWTASGTKEIRNITGSMHTSFYSIN